MSTTKSPTPGWRSPHGTRADDRIPASVQQRRILDSLEDSVVAMDPQLRVTSLNAAAERLLGVSHQRAIGRHCYELFNADRCATTCPVRYTLSTGVGRRDTPIQLRFGGRRATSVQVSTSALRDEEGKLVGAVEILRHGEYPPGDSVPQQRSWAEVPPLPAPSCPSTRAIMQARVRPEDHEHDNPVAQRLAEVLQAHGWHRESTAKALGISRSTLWRRMKELGLID